MPRELRRQAKGDLVVRLVEHDPSADPDVIEMHPFAVILEAGGESAEASFDDAWQANNHFRQTCLMALGISLPYEAPRFEVSTPEYEGTNATDLFYAYHGRIALTRPASDEATAIRDEMMADPSVIYHAEELAALAIGDTWICALIRVVCKRIAYREQKDAEVRQAVAYDDLAGFGAF